MEITATVYAPTRRAWRAWLAKHHASGREVWLIYWKKSSGKPSVSYNDAVEEALCFGWIDSTVRRMDDERYAQRFTPRKKGSNWSAPNLARVDRLVAKGLMTPAGAVHIPSARARKAYLAQHQRRLTATTVAPRDLAAALRKNAAAAAQWKALAPGYRRLYVRRINEARRPDTRARRVADTVARLARGERRPMI